MSVVAFECHLKFNSLCRESYWKGQLSTIDHLVLISSDDLFSILNILFTFVKKQSALTRRSTVLSLPLQLVFLGLNFKVVKFECPWNIKVNISLAFYKWLTNIQWPYSQHFIYSKLKDGPNKLERCITLCLKVLSGTNNVAY